MLARGLLLTSTFTILTAAWKVCVVIPTCSRGQSDAIRSLADTRLYQLPLRSLSHTAETDKYTYAVYVGYDEGDPFFDTVGTLNELKAWFADVPMALVARRVHNPSRKPGPVMNALSRAAYDDNCTFIYRINDDTEMVSPGWTTAFVRTLAAFEPPYMGVVGPTCREGNTAILTHDFVHRTHIDIFGHHYPPELTDWWLDDWITSVYGERNTRKLPDVIVVHHLTTTRYEVTQWNAARLPALLAAGMELVSAAARPKAAVTEDCPGALGIPKNLAGPPLAPLGKMIVPPDWNTTSSPCVCACSRVSTGEQCLCMCECRLVGVH